MKVALIYDVNCSVGMGHKRRCESLVSYMDRFSIDYKIYENLFFEYAVGFLTDSDVSKELSDCEVCILDISTVSYIQYYVDTILSFINNLKNRDKKVIYIDGLFDEDCLHRKVDSLSDYVVIPYFLSERFQYSSMDGMLLLGEKYFVYHPVVLELLNKKFVKKDFAVVSFGGCTSIAYDFMKRLIEFFSLLGMEVVIIEPYHFKRFLAISGSRVIDFLNHEKFLYMLSESKILITSNGLTKYESLALRTPVVILDVNSSKRWYYKDLEQLFPLRYCTSLNEVLDAIHALLSYDREFSLPVKGGELICQIIRRL